MLTFDRFDIREAKVDMNVKFDYNDVPRNGTVHERYGRFPGRGFNPIHLVL